MASEKCGGALEDYEVGVAGCGMGELVSGFGMDLGEGLDVCAGWGGAGA